MPGIIFRTPSIFAMQAYREVLHMGKTCLYFAYGSNMFSARMKKRVPSAAAAEDTGLLHEHRLAFHKIGRLDGTGKCDAHHTGRTDDCLMGVLYRLDNDQVRVLDAIEGCGLGYERKDVTIRTFSGNVVAAFTYCATHIDPDLQPFHWYKRHVLAGAEEHRLPDEYIALIQSIQSIDDHDSARHSRELRIHTLR